MIAIIRNRNSKKLLYVEFALLNGFFNGFLDQIGIPIVIERRFSPDYGFDLDFQFVMAGLTNVPVGQVEVIASRDGSLDDILAYITG